jgi:predicted MFS family arabinose efflux permease
VDRDGDLVAVFLRWVWWRAVLHHGWWLVTSVYLVVDAGLSPSQLVLIGVAQGVTALVFEIPAGVVADTFSRKWSLVASHALMGTAMVCTGLVTDFAALVATQMLWGLSWTLASGADVAWITDELDAAERTSVVLTRWGRAQLSGAAAGIVSLGALGAVTERRTAMVLAGTAMLVLGSYVVWRFREDRFVRSNARRRTLLDATALVRGSRPVLLVLAATFAVNGATDGFGRLVPRRLVDLGLPSDPVVWLTGVGVLTLLVGAAAHRVVERRIDEPHAALRTYVAACLAGTVGALALAAAPEEVSASAAVLVVAGLAVPLTRTMATIWVNAQTTGDVRATVHSYLAQAEYAGEIACGLVLAGVASLAGLAPTLGASAALLVAAAALASGADRLGRR